MAIFSDGGSHSLSVESGNHVFQVSNIGQAVVKQNSDGTRYTYSMMELMLADSGEKTSYFLTVDELPDIDPDGNGITVGMGKTGRAIKAIRPDLSGQVITSMSDLSDAVVGYEVLGTVGKTTDGKYVNVNQLKMLNWQPIESGNYLLKAVDFSKPFKATVPDRFGKMPYKVNVVFEIVDLDEPEEGIHSYNGHEVSKKVTVDNFEELGGSGKFHSKSAVYELMSATLDSIPSDIGNIHNAFGLVMGQYCNGLIKTESGNNGGMFTYIDNLSPINNKQRKALGLPIKAAPVQTPVTTAKPTGNVNFPVPVSKPQMTTPVQKKELSKVGAGSPVVQKISNAPWNNKPANNEIPL